MNAPTDRLLALEEAAQAEDRELKWSPLGKTGDSFYVTNHANPKAPISVVVRDAGDTYTVSWRKGSAADLSLIGSHPDPEEAMAHAERAYREILQSQGGPVE